MVRTLNKFTNASYEEQTTKIWKYSLVLPFFYSAGGFAADKSADTVLLWEKKYCIMADRPDW